ncbi:DUF3267 domain-containing protein [Candidatus Saccharibacteria bacterium]|nr:DUF3267 domain-containing protein [Candidatus Saccharibacteria bacterium]
MKKIETITIDKSQSIALTVQMVFMFFLGGAIFSYVGNASQDHGSLGWPSLAVYVLTIISHELLHGVGFAIAGAKPKFGAAILGIMPVAYATSKDRISIRQALLTSYMPLLVLSAFFIMAVRIFPQYQALFLIGFVGNFAGAVGDLWLSSKLWKYLPFRNAYVVDSPEGMNVYSDHEKAIKLAEKAQTKKRKSHRVYSVFVRVFLVILILQLFGSVLVSAFGFDESFRFGFEQLYLFETVNSVNETSATLNLFTTLMTTLMICGLYFSVQKIIGKTSIKLD